jgi:hypothetical protein
MAVAHDPLLVELRRRLVRQPGRDLAERLWAARGLGEGDGDGFGAEGFGAEEVDLAVFRHRRRNA